MNKILSTLLVGFFAVSINAFAETPAAKPASVHVANAEAAAPAAEVATSAKAEEKHTAAPEAKKTKHQKHAKKAATSAPEVAK